MQLIFQSLMKSVINYKRNRTRFRRRQIAFPVKLRITAGCLGKHNRNEKEEGDTMTEKASRSRGPILALIVLLAVVGVCLTLWLARRPETAEGTKTLSIQVVHGDGSAKDFEFRTEAKNLAQALLEHEPLGVKGDDSQFGLYIQTVDGETASDADQTFWSVSKDGVALTVGTSSQPISDGERYELTLTQW